MTQLQITIDGRTLAICLPDGEVSEGAKITAARIVVDIPEDKYDFIPWLCGWEKAEAERKK